ncbi:hypothetical protein [Dyadobacter frigoris]|uniref:Uncharacterized protein n=1 Tax=Dyadobacter frigoris TaxID=2576211 RepID=A0A4U6CVF6_9BACT|nr:hypothetical protein [Dyadobacter frigoris]TKT85254.1 hypothetical protein FDK13_34240 [Dyadobacter frigoris]
MNHIDKLIANNGQYVHKIKAKDTTGRWAYYFIYVPPHKEVVFIQALKRSRVIDLEDYGTVIGSCYGTEPDETVRQYLLDKYNFSI